MRQIQFSQSPYCLYIRLETHKIQELSLYYVGVHALLLDTNRQGVSNHGDVLGLGPLPGATYILVISCVVITKQALKFHSLGHGKITTLFTDLCVKNYTLFTDLSKKAPFSLT